MRLLPVTTVWAVPAQCGFWLLLSLLHWAGIVTPRPLVVQLQAAENTPQGSSTLPRHAARCRWFILKQGKIFWFKSDVVTPVGVCKSAGCAAE